MDHHIAYDHRNSLVVRIRAQDVDVTGSWLRLSAQDGDVRWQIRLADVTDWLHHVEKGQLTLTTPTRTFEIVDGPGVDLYEITNQADTLLHNHLVLNVGAMRRLIDEMLDDNVRELLAGLAEDLTTGGVGDDLMVGKAWAEALLEALAPELLPKPTASAVQVEGQDWRFDVTDRTTTMHTGLDRADAVALLGEELLSTRQAVELLTEATRAAQADGNLNQPPRPLLRDNWDSDWAVATPASG